MIRSVGWRIGATGALATLVCAASAWGFQPLPAGGQVNDDPGAGIDPALSVSAAPPANADLAAGSLTQRKPGVPWAIFSQSGASSTQVFVRSFANGAWMTRGNGTTGGRSSVIPAFPGSLNFDQTTDAQAPSIDFAGTGRTVPWATWYEQTSGAGFGASEIFASRFDNAAGDWAFAGQGRGVGGGGVPVPSLNIHPTQNAENPSVAGGSTTDATNPQPWIAWQETTSLPVSGRYQIFVSRAEGPGMANCDGIKPLGTVAANGHVPAVGGFCWQLVGTPRVGVSAADPSLNVDPSRNGNQPDIAFTGTNDTVPWVVWYESGTGAPGLAGNDMVFAAKAVADETSSGGFHWVAVGGALPGALDTSGSAHHFGACAESITAEQACALDASSGTDAQDPRVAAGTMEPGGTTVPWVAWDEQHGAHRQVFVARLVNGLFQLANGGQPISAGTGGDSTRPAITFSGRTPYVSWREDTGSGQEEELAGHFVNAASPTFVLDEDDVPLAPSAQADVREPISSSCTANPFDGDGDVCEGGAAGTPFMLSTVGASPRALLASAYEPSGLSTGAAGSITSSAATVTGSVDPGGAPLDVAFNYGTTTAYGQTTAPTMLAPAGAQTPFARSLTGLPAATTIHYQAVVFTDFATFVGGDESFQTGPPPDTTAPTIGIKLVRRTIRQLINSTQLTVAVTISEPAAVKISASTVITAHHLRHTVALGSTTTSLAAAGTSTLTLDVPEAALAELLALKHGSRVTVSGQATDPSGNTSKPKSVDAVFRRR
jgi:hypothetical protein